MVKERSEPCMTDLLFPFFCSILLKIPQVMICKQYRFEESQTTLHLHTTSRISQQGDWITQFVSAELAVVLHNCLQSKFSLPLTTPIHDIHKQLHHLIKQSVGNVRLEVAVAEASCAPFQLMKFQILFMPILFFVMLLKYNDNS